MKKNPNLIHLLESFVLSALLGFFLFFMRRGADAFLPLTLGFSAYAFLFSMLMIYIDGDKPERGQCKLMNIARSDLAFYLMLIQYALSVCFAVWHNLAEVSIAAVTVIYALAPILTLLIILIPAPKEATAPAPTNESGTLKAKSFDYYAALLRKLIGKCEFESLSRVMEQTADLISRIDTEFSVQIDALENDISHKCVKIENALLTHNAAQLALLERELAATLELIEKRCASCKYCLKDEGFYREDDEIAMNQIDLLLDKFGLEYEEDLAALNTPIEQEFFFRKALKFASETYASLLIGYNDQITERLKKDADEQAARQCKRQSRLQAVSHFASLLILVSIAGVTLFWHFSLQPFGLFLSENDDGTLTLIGYNPIYGDELTVPATVKGKQITVIGKEALKGSALTQLTLSEGIERIEYQAVRDCDALETLILPKSLTSIGHYAFKNDESLVYVRYRGSATDWDAVEIGVNGNDEFKAIEIEFEYSE